MEIIKRMKLTEDKLEEIKQESLKQAKDILSLKGK